MTRVTKRRAARVLTAAYSLLLPATAIIMSCVAVWATVRMDLTIGRKAGPKNER